MTSFHKWSIRETCFIWKCLIWSINIACFCVCVNIMRCAHAHRLSPPLLWCSLLFVRLRRSAVQRLLPAAPHTPRQPRCAATAHRRLLCCKQSHGDTVRRYSMKKMHGNNTLPMRCYLIWLFATQFTSTAFREEREESRSHLPASWGTFYCEKWKGVCFLGQTDQTEIHFVTCCVTDVTGATERIWHLSDGWRDRGRQMLMLCRKCRGAEHIQSKC